MELEVEAELWEWQGKGAWFFVTIPKQYYPDLKSISLSQKKGFGSLKVEVVVGSSRWKTSIFPDNESKTFLLPVKKSIRKSEDIRPDDRKTYIIKLIEV